MIFQSYPAASLHGQSNNAQMNSKLLDEADRKDPE
jgi:hypothetical protein